MTIYTDHKPLIGLFGEDKAIPSSATPRMQRWALILAGYEYSLKFKAAKNNTKANSLSPLPLQEMPAKIPENGENILVMDHLDCSLVTATDVKRWTQRNAVLSKVAVMIQSG